MMTTNERLSLAAMRKANQEKPCNVIAGKIGFTAQVKGAPCLRDERKLGSKG